MELAARTGAWRLSGAPLPYLRRVAYLESHGTEWIDTGIIPSHQTNPKSVFVYERRRSGVVMMGCFVGNRWNIYDGDGYIQVGIGNSIKNVVPQSTIGAKNTVTLDWGTKSATANGIVVSGYSGRLSTGSMYLFARRYSDFSISTSCRLFDFEHYDGNDLIAKYISVLDLSGRPAMYDEVSGQFFYNQGTGEFTWGELDASSGLVSSRGGGTKCLTPRRSYRRLARPSARFCARSTSQRWEVAA